jgi:cytochrome c oxidase accessory protein FixG
MPSVLPTPQRFLPTLNADGTRRRIRPRLFDGRYLRARRVVGWALMLLFWTLPFVRVGGKPAVLLDIPARAFQLFGATFRATDGVVLMLALLVIFVGVFALTAWVGRVWCGWGCPQTVYMELLFRPLELWIEGGRGAQQRLDREGANGRRWVKYAAFAVLSLALANVFLAYFVGTERLATWMTSSPLAHPTGFTVLSLTAALIYADFGVFREQMCTVACPYARLQSVLLDPKSIIVGYDARRGEPRGRGAGRGDCVDCGACVVTCPTGIDIREGLQLECISCAQCVDACDSVMTKFKRPTGLIRYASQQAFQASRASLGPARPRLVVYPALLVVLVGALIYFGGRASQPEVTLLRGIGAPYELRGGRVQNQIRIKIENRSAQAASYSLALLGIAEAELVAPENPLRVAPGQRAETSVFVLVPRQALPLGSRDVLFGVRDERGLSLQVPYRLLGPRNSAAKVGS